MKYFSRIKKDSEFSNISLKGTVINISKQYKSVNVISEGRGINLIYENEIPEEGETYFFMIFQPKDRNISIIKDFIKL